MATSKSGIKATKKKTSIRKGATVGKALTKSARAVTSKAKRVVAASKKKSMTRTTKKTMGFAADIQSRHERNLGKLFELTQPEDLIKFGLIPEFVGRIPVVATLHELNESALVEILTRPKNALVKQYQRLFDFEGVKLEFTEEATRAVARQAILRKGGARGLRSILEHIILDVMYEIPSRTDVRKCVITEDVVEGKNEPEIIEGKKAELA